MAGIPVTVSGVTGGAMVEVPRRPGQASSAFWTGQQDSYPPDAARSLLAWEKR